MTLAPQIPGLTPATVVSAFQTSQPLVLPNARILSTVLAARATGTIGLRLSCPTGATRCTGNVTIRTLTAIVAPGSKSHRTVILTLASGAFAIDGGKVATLTLHLTGPARALLARKNVLRERATILAHATSAPTHTTQAVVTILAYKPKPPSRG
jgi:hypothetical protein